jgi:hypothetical protein
MPAMMSEHRNPNPTDNTAGIKNDTETWINSLAEAHLQIDGIAQACAAPSLSSASSPPKMHHPTLDFGGHNAATPL